MEIDREWARDLSSAPGVYRMIDSEGVVLYVGKARNLRRRVLSYFRSQGLPPKTSALMAQAKRIEVTVTHTENEALVLEHNLIKSLRPRYNVLLRDDKSYPYIFIGVGDAFPRLGFHRGAKSAKGRYFGPFPGSGAVRESLNLLEKVFRLRNCQDSVFAHRSRPCLQYQIGRCRAPCVGYVSASEYGQDVHQTVMFLEGKGHELIEELRLAMSEAARQTDYETAGLWRDRIAALSAIQERQYVQAQAGDADVLAVVAEGGLVVVETLWVRAGAVLGSRAYFPTTGLATTPEEWLSEFIGQYYLSERPVPETIYVDRRLPEAALLAQALSGHASHRVRIVMPTRGVPRRWLQMVTVNAADELRRRLATRLTLDQQFAALQEVLALSTLERVECFDISHSQGEAATAACVAFDHGGPVKARYRRYRVDGVTPGDDYAAMAEAVRRRYRPDALSPENRPELVLIDGGRGQLAVALEAARDVGFVGSLFLAVSKGPERRPGEETLWRAGSDEPLALPAAAPARHLIQKVRDEAHRFAITGHRGRRDRARVHSALEDVPGVGRKRRQALLSHLGGLQVVARAGVEDLARVPGISPTLAQRIYDAFHEG